MLIILHPFSIRGTRIFIDSKLFLEPQDPELPPFPGVHSATFCFLISNGQRHIVFDLGVRPDWENCAPRIVSLLREHNTVARGRDVATIITESAPTLGISTADVEAIVWSHNHFDHTGDPSTFPSCTKLVVGPGVTAASWPGYPTRAEAIVRDSDAAGRLVEEVSFKGSELKIGRFDAVDYFGDGSFYLLDAPGHAVGHMCALARTSSEPPSFIFMGADCCHHAGALRPSKNSLLDLQGLIGCTMQQHGCSGAANRDLAAVGGKSAQKPVPCPGDFLLSILDKANDRPLFGVPRNLIFPEHDAAVETVAKIQELDSLDEVFVIISHDMSIRDHIPLFPDNINGWREADLRRRTRWLFLKDFKDGV